MNKKKIIPVILSTMLLITSLTGCGGNDKNIVPESTVKEDSVIESTISESVTESGSDEAVSKTPESPTTETTENISEKDTARTLVIYFSATGTTKGVAEKIASVTGADLYEIVPKETYTDADLNYNDSGTRATREQNDPDARPKFETIDLDIENNYSTVFLGYPIWWGQEPRIMDTFVESYDLSDITVIPFCTSGSSGIGSSGKSLSEKAGSGRWLEGNRFSGTVTEDEIRNWIAGLDI
ncbi:Flavodoxin [Oribacterium sp. KHPX15]|uniref:flavodoxin n=1 Tax=Oribacterium sp. KHPX15 TaxID=1855342 RepID=UPI000897A03F|nr:flavodoxin [Oribacterium sp. KHPX15]SDZ83542.1 Flavodoxin [Oribacterium sp. KHPX15]